MGKLTCEDIVTIMDGYDPVGEHGYHHFSILVPLIDGEEPELLYEVRAQKLNRQPGEICFPGGMIEPGETPEQCALRETREEVGIPEESVRIVCKLDSVFSTAGSQLHCYLGVIDRQTFEQLQPCPNEVEEVFTVPVNELLEMEPEVYQSQLIQEPDADFPYDKVTGGKPYPWRCGTSPVPIYYVGERVIWGLTGRITKQLMEVLNHSNKDKGEHSLT